MDDEKLLLAEYKHFSDSFWKSEEIGERRVNFYITLTTAIIAGSVALVTVLLTNNSTDSSYLLMRQIFTVALSGTFLFGLLTFLRMVQRNRVTDEYINIINYLRERLRMRSSRLCEYKLPFKPAKRRLFKGGLAETVAAMNGFLLAVITALWPHEGWGWIAPPGVFLCTFAPQAIFAGKRKQRKEENNPRSQTFRAGVGAVIVDRRREKILMLERRDVPGEWQLPQGGLEVGEDPLEAVYREICEETGIEKSDLRQLAAESRLLAYELPREYRSKKTGRGQAQYWFMFSFKSERPDEAITLGDKKEFKDWKWGTMDELVSNVVPFRRSVYQELEKILSRLPQDTT